jgi:hypothetical protein
MVLGMRAYLTCKIGNPYFGYLSYLATNVWMVCGVCNSKNAYQKRHVLQKRLLGYVLKL